VGTIRFRRPILVGHQVELIARIVYTGTTSMHVLVQVRSGDTKGGEMLETNHCIISFVALDAEGNTATVPAWVPLTDEDQFLQAYAVKTKAFSQEVEQDMLNFYQQNS
jgi:acyl-CoA hydrolase